MIQQGRPVASFSELIGVPFYFYQWDNENEQHVAEHGITSEEFEEVVSDPVETQQSQSSGRPMAFGYTASGKYLACVYEFLDDVTVYPITAYEVED
ncbi:hypothetical protein LBMAG52_27990 [Planctomycetia bacterium]|nr:hypothetical protein LBMAG52_27990 [Planctomycetia bacterium]